MIGRIFAFPRVRLTTLPTPMERASRLGGELGIELFVKRDDVMELALGGNKVRKLEFIMGDALSQGSDVVITTGAFHSNHARLTAAAARKLGLDVYLVLTPPRRPVVNGNLLLDRLFGAGVLMAKDRDEAKRLVEDLEKKLRKEGRRPYVIPGGGASPHGVLGYVLAALEIAQQLYEMNKRARYIVHATGSGTTQAGLVLGAKLLGLDVEVVGISVGAPADRVRERVAELANKASDLLGAKVRVEPEEVTVFDNYTYGGYAEITREVVEVMELAARSEGLVLDPVYTAKALAGLIDLVNRGYIEKGSVVVFIHTGGTPIPFQYSEEVVQYLTK